VTGCNLSCIASAPPPSLPPPVIPSPAIPSLLPQIAALSSCHRPPTASELDLPLPSSMWCEDGEEVTGATRTGRRRCCNDSHGRACGLSIPSCNTDWHGDPVDGARAQILAEAFVFSESGRVSHPSIRHRLKIAAALGAGEGARRW
jgi:hypothetical protein